jgi:hypothetical protein
MTKCRWFIRCDAPAVTTLPHPILGAVPVCQRCHDKIQALEAASRAPNRPVVATIH